MFVGLADLIPGVSGGTIAFILGIYRPLFAAIAAINRKSLQLCFAGEWTRFWQTIHGNFLCAVFGGIITSIFCFSSSMLLLMSLFPIFLYSFFEGLIIASALYFFSTIEKKSLYTYCYLFISCTGTYYFIQMDAWAIPNGYLWILLTGMLAICAMILPGISGSLVLIFFNKYTLLLQALSNLQFDILGFFVLGCFLGLFLFVRIIQWLLRYYSSTILSVLVGFMLGSLGKLWPWQICIENIYKNYYPWHYEKITGKSAHFGSALLCIFLGAGLFLALIRWQNKRRLY